MSLDAIFIGSAIAQTADGGASPGGGSPFGMFLPMIAVFVIFYFLLIRPQSKQRKKHVELLKGLKKGDEVVTASGIHGRVAEIEEGTVRLEIAQNVRIKVEKPQVARVKTTAT